MNHRRCCSCPGRKLSLFAVALLSLFATAAPQAWGEVKLPSVFSSNMVLQRDREIPVWGVAAPGEAVTIELAGNKATAVADPRGKWQTKLPALALSTEPLKMTVSGTSAASTKNKIEFDNILVGEVWVCSGQSNMQWSVAQSNDGGKEIAEANHPNIRLYHVPTVQLRNPAETVLNARWVACSPQTVGGFSAVGYYFGRDLQKELKVPIGLIANAWGGRRIEPFTPAIGVESVPALAGKPQGELSIIYNGMVAPVAPFPIRGAIWYQGESNMGEGMLYADRKRALVAGWRKVWNQGEFPFYWAQLAPFKYGGQPYALPELWEAQTAALDIPHTGMAVLTDIGNPGDIHPRNKQDVGARLARWALNRDYGRKDVVPSGPLYKSMKVEGNKIRVHFAYADGGLKTRDDKPLTDFEVAGADGKFVPAKATIDGQTVVVEAEGIAEPTQVRFCWNGVASPNFVNSAGLPAGPFRSLDWKGATGE